MSVTITIVGILPATAAWPAIAGAAATAASALGFAMATGKEKARVEADAIEVDICLENAATVTGNLAVGEELVFTREGVQVRFFRDAEGNTGIRVHGHGRRDELRRIGEEFAGRVVQQYAYHQLITELKSRDLNITDEVVEEDGTVRLHVRTYRETHHGNA